MSVSCSAAILRTSGEDFVRTRSSSVATPVAGVTAGSRSARTPGVGEGGGGDFGAGGGGDLGAVGEGTEGFAGSGPEGGGAGEGLVSAGGFAALRAGCVCV